MFRRRSGYPLIFETGRMSNTIEALQKILVDGRCRLPHHFNDERGRNALDIVQVFDALLVGFRKAIDDALVGQLKVQFLAEIECAESLAEGVKRAITTWLSDGPSDAQNILLESLRVALGPIDHDSPMPTFHGQIGRLVRTELSTELPMYRARTAPVALRLKRKDFLHIPFQQRWKVSTQRYSSPGMPCLYLSESCAGCWEELGRPDHDSLWFARFGLKAVGQPGKDREAVVLDFGLPPHIVGNSLVDSTSPNVAYARAYLAAWPLIAACSIQVRTDDPVPFRAEYIVPQLLLRLLRRLKLDGVRYFSTVPEYCEEVSIQIEASNRLMRNYAFPVRSDRPEGHCGSLLGLFLIGDGVSWTQMLDCQEELSAAGVDPDIDAKARFPLDAPYEYGKTLFRRMERFLIQYDRMRAWDGDSTSALTVELRGLKPLNSQEYSWEHMGKLLSRGPDAWDVLQPQLSIYPAAVASLRFLVEENYIDHVEFETIPPNSVADVSGGTTFGTAKAGIPKCTKVFERLLELHSSNSPLWVRFKARVTDRGKQALTRT